MNEKFSQGSAELSQHDQEMLLNSQEELETSIDEIWSELDLRHSLPKTEEEIEKLPLNQLFTESSIPENFWQNISEEMEQKIRGIYLQRTKRGISTPPKIGRVLELTAMKSEELLKNVDQQRTFLNVLEEYVEERTHPRRHLPIDNYLEGFFRDKPFTLVDLGCSKGYITERLAKKFPQAKVIGLDLFFPPDFSTSNKKARYIKADLLAEHLPLNQVDCFVCTSVWEHLAPQAAKQTLEKMAHSLNEGGIIIEGVIEKNNGKSGYLILQKKEGRLKQINFLPYKVKR